MIYFPSEIVEKALKGEREKSRTNKRAYAIGFAHAFFALGLLVNIETMCNNCLCAICTCSVF